MTQKPTIESVLLRAFDYNSALKRVDRSDDEVQRLKSLLQQLKWIPKIVTEKHCLIYLSTGDTVEEAFEKLKIFFRLKLHTPEVFRFRNPYSEEIAKTVENANFLFLPVTPQGYNVVYASLRNYNVSAFVFDSIAKVFFMTAEACIFKNGPQKGIIFLVDMAGGKLFHLSKVNLKTIKMGLKFVLDACPQKIIGFHLLNAVPFYELIMQIMKPFSRKELRLLLHLHYADINWEEFYEKHIPRSCLPSDYGGDLESVDVLHQKNFEELKNRSDYFQVEGENLYEDESLEAE